MFDILIKNGTIVDGTGNPMYKGDIGIKDDIISEIGDLHNESAEKIIDAKGCYVAPGFVDVNNHSDTYWRMFIDPQLESLLFQGITTIIGGNCGSSLAPLVSKDMINSIRKWVDVSNVNFNWLTMEEFLNEIERKIPAVNFATLVGHSTLRRGLLGDEVRDIREEEIQQMEKMLKAAMKQGAVGFSTGLVYTHARGARDTEIERLAEVVKKYDGVYTSHIRGEAGELIDAVEEAIRIASKTGVKMEISHLKAMGEKNWHLMDEAINLIETARMSGLDINFDVYPYSVTGSVLYILLPDWVAEGGRRMMIERLKDPETRKKVIHDMRKDEIDYSKITISISPLNKTLVRRKIEEIAKTQEKTIEDAIIDLLIASDGHVVTMMEILSEKNVRKAIQNPFSIIVSNGSGYSLDHKSTGEIVHPRNFGSFPRVLLRYVKEEGVLSWEEAIHKMTGLPAKKFNLKNRGELKEKNFADVVVINPKTIQDTASVDNPYKYAKGVDYVLINGKVAVEQDTCVQKRHGQVLRRENKKIFDF